MAHIIMLSNMFAIYAVNWLHFILKALYDSTKCKTNK